MYSTSFRLYFSLSDQFVAERLLNKLCLDSMINFEIERGLVCYTASNCFLCTPVLCKVTISRLLAMAHKKGYFCLSDPHLQIAKLFSALTTQAIGLLWCRGQQRFVYDLDIAPYLNELSLRSSDALILTPNAFYNEYKTDYNKERSAAFLAILCMAVKEQKIKSQMSPKD